MSCAACPQRCGDTCTHPAVSAAYKDEPKRYRRKVLPWYCPLFVNQEPEHDQVRHTALDSRTEG